MAQPMSVIQADFDRIALLSDEGWNHNNHYHDFLLQRIPTRCNETLEIGCGTGRFSRLLAEQSRHVLALDLSPEMIRTARERSGEVHNIDFQVADAFSWKFPSDRFDCIATIATLHHLPLAEMLANMKDALTDRGVLLVLDLFQPEGLKDMISNAVALPLSFALRLARLREFRRPCEVRQAWAEHDRHDSFPTIRQVRQVCAEVLPGAKITTHLLWRYSIVWEKARL